MPAAFSFGLFSSALSSHRSAASASSPRLHLLLCLLTLVQLLLNANAALLLPLDSALFARSNSNGPFASYRRNLFPIVSFAGPISRRLMSSDQMKHQQQQQHLAQFDLSKKRSLHPPALLLGNEKLENGQIEMDQFVPLQLPQAAIASDETMPSTADQCFCCRAFVCRKQICPCSKFLI